MFIWLVIIYWTRGRAQGSIRGRCVDKWRHGRPRISPGTSRLPSSCLLSRFPQSFFLSVRGLVVLYNVAAVIPLVLSVNSTRALKTPTSPQRDLCHSIRLRLPFLRRTILNPEPVRHQIQIIRHSRSNPDSPEIHQLLFQRGRLRFRRFSSKYRSLSLITRGTEWCGCAVCKWRL